MDIAAAYRRPSSQADALKRWLVAAACVVALLALLLVVRLIGTLQKPELIVTEIEVIPLPDLPAPPEALPPPESVPLPSPPLALPHLEVEINPVSPPVRSSPAPALDFRLEAHDFAFDTPPPIEIPPIRTTPAPRTSAPRPAAPRVAATERAPAPPKPVPQPKPQPPPKSVYQAGELDGRPTLRNNPSPAFPRELARRGITQGRAVLDIEIDTAGRVTVRSVVSVSHPELRPMALEAAHRARFTIPKKDGKPVRARFRWPLVLKQ